MKKFIVLCFWNSMFHCFASCFPKPLRILFKYWSNCWYLSSKLWNHCLWFRDYFLYGKTLNGSYIISPRYQINLHWSWADKLLIIEIRQVPMWIICECLKGRYSCQTKSRFNYSWLIGEGWGSDGSIIVRRDYIVVFSAQIRVVCNNSWERYSNEESTEWKHTKNLFYQSVPSFYGLVERNCLMHETSTSRNLSIFIQKMSCWSIYIALPNRWPNS